MKKYLIPVVVSTALTLSACGGPQTNTNAELNRADQTFKMLENYDRCNLFACLYGIRFLGADDVVYRWETRKEDGVISKLRWLNAGDCYRYPVDSALHEEVPCPGS